MTSWPLCSPGRYGTPLSRFYKFDIAANNPWLQQACCVIGQQGAAKSHGPFDELATMRTKSEQTHAKPSSTERIARVYSRVLSSSAARIARIRRLLICTSITRV